MTSDRAHRDRPPVDVVVSAAGSWAALRDCLTALEAGTAPGHARLWLRPQGVTLATRRRLVARARRQTDVRVLGQRPTARTLAALDAPHLVLLDGAALVPPGWLERLLAHAAADGAPAAIELAPGPRPPPGSSHLGVDRWLRSTATAPGTDPRTAPRGLLLVRDRLPSARRGPRTARPPGAPPAWATLPVVAARGCLRSLGVLTRRATDVGLGVTGGTEPLLAGPPPAELAVPSRPPGRQAWRNRLGRPLRHLRAGRPAVGLADGLRGVAELAGRRRRVVVPAALAAATRPGALRVTYLLWNLDLHGGCLSVLQLVNALILRGVEARVATLDDRPGASGWPLYTEPLIFADAAELCRDLPETDVVVATLWHTAPWVPEILRRQGQARGAYFIQDYEPWFYPEGDTRRSAVRDTYRLIAERIVKSRWLADRLAAEGVATHRIPLGLDLGRFHPRDVAPARHPRLVAMARPSTPRRGFATLVAALRRVQQARPDTAITLFGEGVDPAGHGLRARSLGPVHEPERLAALYSAADLLLDTSEFQGFGRPALEAMACGTPAVLTAVGGVTEYARDGRNCLVVPPDDPGATAAAILALLDDPEQRARLASGARRTARRYDHRREAERTHALLARIAERSR